MLVMIEMFVVDFMFMGDKRVIVFKLIGVAFISWLWLVLTKNMIKKMKSNFDKADAFTEKVFFGTTSLYLFVLIIFFVRFIQNPNFINYWGLLNSSFSWLEGFFIVCCVKSFKRWKKTKNYSDLFFLWPLIGKKML